MRMGPVYTPYKSYHNVDEEKNESTSKRIVDLASGEDVAPTLALSFPYMRFASFATVLAFLGTSATIMLVEKSRTANSSASSQRVYCKHYQWLRSLILEKFLDD